MTNPIGPAFSGARTVSPGEDERSFARCDSTPPKNPPRLPDPPNVDHELFARYAMSAQLIDSPTQSFMLQAAAESHRAHDVDVQRLLDAFRARASAVYRTPWGSAQVAVPFRIHGGYPNEDPAQYHEGRVVAPNRERLFAVAAKLGMAGAICRVQDGRGTLEEVRRLTQGLIDGGCLAAPGGDLTLEQCVRKMMFDFGIGIDCAGYSGLAFTASRAGLDPPAPALLPQDALIGLGYRGFERIDLDRTRPGDIVVLEPPDRREYGHTGVVYDAHDAQPSDRAWLLEHARALECRTAQASRQMVVTLREIAQLPRLRVMSVDSSWGSNGNPQTGGVERRTWVHDAAHGRWVWLDREGGLFVTPTPYGHPVQSAYRPRNEM